MLRCVPSVALSYLISSAAILTAQQPDPPTEAETRTERQDPFVPVDRPELVPPRADFAAPDEHAAPGRGVLEIDQLGVVSWAGEPVYVPAHDGDDRSPIRRVLRVFRNRAGTQKQEVVVGGHTLSVVTEPVLIRADKWTAWDNVSLVMALCAEPTIAIPRLEFGVSETGRFRQGQRLKFPVHLPLDAPAPVAGDVPDERLDLRIVCEEYGEQQPRRLPDSQADQASEHHAFDVTGHRVHWQLGPRRIDSLETLRGILDEFARDPNRRVPAADGGTKLMTVVIKPGPSTTYGDVVTVHDALRAAGFETIHFAARNRGSGR